MAGRAILVGAVAVAAVIVVVATVAPVGLDIAGHTLGYGGLLQFLVFGHFQTQLELKTNQQSINQSVHP